MVRMLFVLFKQLEPINEGKKPSKDIFGEKGLSESHVASKTTLGNGGKKLGYSWLDQLWTLLRRSPRQLERHEHVTLCTEGRKSIHEE